MPTPEIGQTHAFSPRGRSKKFAHAAGRCREDVKRERESWLEGRPGLNPEKLILATTKMGRLFGRSPRGERCRAALPHGDWKTATFTAGLRVGGLAAPMILDRPMDGDAYRAYVRQVAVPELEPGAFVVMDNLLTHKVSGVGTQSRRRARGSFIFRHTRQTTTQSKWPAQNSKHSCAPPSREQFPDLWGALKKALDAHPMYAEIISPLQDTMHADRNCSSAFSDFPFRKPKLEELRTPSLISSCALEPFGMQG